MRAGCWLVRPTARGARRQLPSLPWPAPHMRRSIVPSLSGCWCAHMRRSPSPRSVASSPSGLKLFWDEQKHSLRNPEPCFSAAPYLGAHPKQKTYYRQLKLNCWAQSGSTSVFAGQGMVQVYSDSFVNFSSRAYMPKYK
jgi:hypothetical protein